MNNTNQFFIDWDDKYLTGCEEIDNIHKELIKGTKKLYEYYLDTKKYSKEIVELAHKLEDMMIEHMEYENKLFKKNNISEFLEHKKNHEDYKAELTELKKFKLPKIINAFMISELIVRYFVNHFSIYDVKDIEELHSKNSEVK